MVVLDTNVVSELMRDDPHSDVLVWLDDRPTRELFVTAAHREGADARRAHQRVDPAAGDDREDLPEADCPATVSSTKAPRPRSVAEEVEIGGIEVLRIGELVPALAGSGPVVVQARKTASRTRWPVPGTFRLDPIEPSADGVVPPLVRRLCRLARGAPVVSGPVAPAEGLRSAVVLTNGARLEPVR